MGLTIAQAIKKLLIKEPFYGLFLLSLNKKFDTSIPTACVSRAGINVELLINKDFWDSLTTDQELAVLEHEVLHLCHHHLTMQADFPNKKHFNIASDVEINSYIKNLPDGCLTADKYNLPPTMGTKFYYENIPEDKDDHKTLDVHDWKDFQDLSEAEKKLIENQIDHIAKQTAEQVEKMCGNIPAGLTDYIKSLFVERPAVFNWKSYFRRVIGNSIKSFLKSTRYRPSHRFKGQPGTCLKFKPKVVVAVDTSGSVSNDELQDFFTEIEYLHKSGVGVDVLEFDTNIQNKFEYKGKKTDIKIVGRGGTDVSPCFDYYKQHKEYSTLVVFTDGYLNIRHLPKCQNVIWVITSNGQRQNYPGISIYIPKKTN